MKVLLVASLAVFSIAAFAGPAVTKDLDKPKDRAIETAGKMYAVDSDLPTAKDGVAVAGAAAGSIVIFDGKGLENSLDDRHGKLAALPEPGTWAVMGIGLTGLIVRRARKRR